MNYAGTNPRDRRIDSSTRRPRSPWVSLVMFLALAGIAYGCYANRNKIKSLFGREEAVKLSAAQCTEMVDVVEEMFDRSPEFIEVRGAMNWRPNEQRYRMEVLVEGESDAEAKVLCQKIAEQLFHRIQATVSVFAFDAAGRQCARFIK